MIIKFIIAFYKYIVLYKALNVAYKIDNIPMSMSKLLNIPLHIDIFNRIYGVLHPITQQINNGQSAIFDINPDGTYNAETSIRMWLSDRLFAMSQFMSSQNLLDCLLLDLKKIDDDNYLIIMSPIYLPKLKERAIKMLCEIIIIAIIAAICFIYL